MADDVECDEPKKPPRIKTPLELQVTTIIRKSSRSLAKPITDIGSKPHSVK